MSTAALQRRFERRIIVMGVSGSGKSTLGALLAGRLGLPFIEGDTLHPAENVAKMARGEPLTDADREPWLDRVAAALAGGPAVAACSALKRSYRDRIRAAAGAVSFVYLEGKRDLIARRLAARQGHFMPPGLLESQFAALEPPGPDEAISVPVVLPPEAAVNRILAALGAQPSSSK